MKTDNYYMDQCEKIGKAASLKGNPAVGALILKDDEIISEAEEASKNKNDITCHHGNRGNTDCGKKIKIS